MNIQDLIQIISQEIGVGSYRLSNGRIERAISILPDIEFGWDLPPSGTEINGIEIVIEQPVAPRIQPLIGNDIIEEYQWKIVLKEWGRNEVILGNAVKKLIEILDREGFQFSNPTIVPASQELNLLAMAEISIVEKFVCCYE